MSKQMTTDVDNLPTAFYETTINTNIPAEAFDITEAQWQEFIDNPGERVWNPSTLEVDVYTPTLTLTETKDLKQTELKQDWIAEILLGFTCVVNSLKMDVAQLDINLLQSGYDFAVELSEITMNIRDYDNVVAQNVAIADVATMLTELKSHYRIQLDKKWDLQGQVDAATDIATVDAISW